jgi:hypothetical protein
MTRNLSRHARIEHHEASHSEHNVVAGKGRRRKLSQTKEELLLAMYRSGEMTTVELGKLFGTSQSSVTIAAKRAAVPLRGRGTRRQIQPSPAAQKILLEAWATTNSLAAARFQMSRQNVSRLRKRWQAWMTAEFGPRILPSDLESIASGSPQLVPPKQKNEKEFLCDKSGCYVAHPEARAPQIHQAGGLEPASMSKGPGTMEPTEFCTQPSGPKSDEPGN